MGILRRVPIIRPLYEYIMPSSAAACWSQPRRSQSLQEKPTNLPRVLPTLAANHLDVNASPSEKGLDIPLGRGLGGRADRLDPTLGHAGDPSPLLETIWNSQISQYCDGRLHVDTIPHGNAAGAVPHNLALTRWPPGTELGLDGTQSFIHLGRRLRRPGQCRPNGKGVANGRLLAAAWCRAHQCLRCPPPRPT